MDCWAHEREVRLLLEYQFDGIMFLFVSIVYPALSPVRPPPVEVLGKLPSILRRLVTAWSLCGLVQACASGPHSPASSEQPAVPTQASTTLRKRVCVCFDHFLPPCWAFNGLTRHSKRF